MWIGANFTPLLIYLQDNTMVQLLGEIKNISLLGAGRGKRLVARFADENSSKSHLDGSAGVSS